MTDAVTVALDKFKSTFHNMLGNITSTGTLAGAYSPVTLNQDWSWGGRLLFIVFACCFGSVMNIFFISSFNRERHLQRFGYMFLSCAGLADLVITAGVMPVSAVVLLSGQWDNDQVCFGVQIFGLMATYAYIMYFSFVAIENYYQICTSMSRYEAFLNMRLVCISNLICLLSLGLAVIGVIFGLDYDYCHREHYGNVYYRVATAVIFQVVPVISTVVCFIVTITKIRRRARDNARYRRSIIYKCDYSMVTMNAAAYFIFLVSWMPYVVIVHEYPGTSDAVYYNSVAVGLFRAVFVSSLYGLFHRCHRRAYGYFFNYCCFKNTLSVSPARRHRRRNYVPAAGVVFVPTRQAIYDPNQQPDSQSGFEETQNL